VEYPPVLTKNDFVKRYEEGEFGNASPTWNDISSFLKEVDLSWEKDGQVLYHIRNRVKGGPTWYNVHGVNLPVTWEQCVRGGANVKDLYVSEMAPTELTTMQGEVMFTPEGMSLFYSFVKKPMREALKENSKNAHRLTARVLLETFMNAKSLDWLNELFDRYPEHVVEFSCYNRCWGTLSGFNTVYWEIRKY